jgi:hypothetical protein
MNKLALWTITADGPKRVVNGAVAVEKDLESWVEHDPELLQFGLEIIGRQVSVEAGRVDLLGIDPFGRFVVIEIKRGPLFRETLVQGLDYAECILTMSGDELVEKCNNYLKPQKKDLHAILRERDAMDQLNSDQREVVLCVVGISKTPRLEKVTRILKKSLPILLVIFEVFEIGKGQKVLVREISEADENDGRSRDRRQTADLEKQCKEAELLGVGRDFRLLCDTAKKLNLYPRLWKNSVMFTHPSMRNRMIFTIWVKPRNGKLLAYLSPEAIAEFFPVTERRARKAVGDKGWYQLSTAEVKALAARLEDLLAEISEKEK